jgi:hypothetical protein
MPALVLVSACRIHRPLAKLSVLTQGGLRSVRIIRVTTAGLSWLLRGTSRVDSVVA